MAHWALGNVTGDQHNDLMTESGNHPAYLNHSAGSESTSPAIAFGLVVLDTDEPKRLADFYAALLSWDIVRADEDWVTIRPSTGSEGAGPGLAFQLVVNYQPPTWPTGAVPQQLHLDLDVADLAGAQEHAESLGAKRVVSAGRAGSFAVFLDPSGHPFCLCAA